MSAHPPTRQRWLPRRANTIRWQIEERRGTERLDGHGISFGEEPPACGRIGGGSVNEKGLIQMVVTIEDPLMPGSEC